MKKHVYLLALGVLSGFISKAQVTSPKADSVKIAGKPADTAKAPAPSTDTPLTITGSVDTYFKYDFSGYINNKTGQSNIPTSFGNEQNSVSIGMIDVVLKKTIGKTSFVGELGFGPRGQYQSIPEVNPFSGGTGSFHVQNLYINYAVSDKFALTAGYMQTFIGYEVIAATGNFNYSTSHLFTNGPFENAGLKGTYTFSPKASLMVGIFNNWNVYQEFNGVNNLGIQLTLNPVKGWTAYLNFISGTPSGTEYDLTTNYQITDAFKLGLNAADYSAPGSGGFSGAALYAQYAFTPKFTLGGRGEYFQPKNTVSGGVTTTYASTTSFTLSGNVKLGAITLIPEFRFDGDSMQDYFKSSTSIAPDTKSASQFLLAAVYAF